MNLLTTSEVAKILNVCTKSVTRLCSSGQLKHYRIQKSIRISQDDLNAYLQSCLIS